MKVFQKQKLLLKGSKVSLKKRKLILLSIIISNLFTIISLVACTTPFTYQWDTEIKNDDQLSRGFKRLKKSPLFDRRTIRNPAISRPLLFQRGGFEVSVRTEDGEDVTCMYFNRNSNVLLVAGPGFTNPKEILCPFVDMFERYDIVLLGFRGQNYREEPISWCPCKWQGNPLTQKFGLDNRKIKLGAIEEQDVFATINYFKSQKNYAQVVGLGICYAALIFLKAESMRHRLFDKLILDGCWLSTELFVDKIYHDPKLIFSPQYGGWKNHKVFGQTLVRNLMHWLGNIFLDFKTNNINALDFLPKLRKNIPLLLFYGKNYLTITREEFEILWSNLNVITKRAVITSNPHVINHLEQPKLYKTECESFIEQA